MSPCIDIDEILASLKLQVLNGSDLGPTGRNANVLCHNLFTSDSTDTPKGVMLEHGAVLHNALTRTLQFAAMTSDIFCLDVCMTLTCGGCLVPASLSVVIGDLASHMQKTAIIYAQLTPTIILLIDPAGVPRLETLVRRSPVSEHCEPLAAPRTPIQCLWADRDSCVHHTRAPSKSSRSACIGHVISGLDICIRAGDGVDEVAEGEVDEICVAGARLFLSLKSS